MLRTVPKAEYRDVIIALQAFSGIHICIDNLNVPRSVAMLIDRGIEGTSSLLSKMVISKLPSTMLRSLKLRAIPIRPWLMGVMF